VNFLFTRAEGGYSAKEGAGGLANLAKASEPLMPEKPRNRGQTSSGPRKGGAARAKPRPEARPSVAKKQQQNPIAPPKADTVAETPRRTKEEQTQELGPRQSQRSAAEQEELEQRIVELEESQRYRDIIRLVWKRWRSLAKKKEFVWETMALKYQLTKAYAEKPDFVKRFFSPTFNVAAPQLRSVEKKIDGVTDENIRRLLRRYARHAVRYGIAFSLRAKSPYFRVRSSGFAGDNFHVVIRNGEIEPVVRPLGEDSPYEEAPLSDAFGSDEPIPPAVQPLMTGRENLARYVVIDDTEDFSLLNQLMDFAYSPNQVTVIRYNSTTPRTFFLIGENVPLNKVFGSLKRVAAAAQREVTGSDQRGMTPNLRKLHGQLNLILRRGTGRESATRLLDAEERRVASETEGKKDYLSRRQSIESHLSQLKRQLED
jgi:hypothetical protein